MRETHFCPCGSSALFNDCCGLYISGQKLPETAEKLMRSRYSAFAKKDLRYLESTMRDPALERFDQEETQAWLGSIKWESLKVVKSYPHPQDSNLAYVSFIATYKSKGKRYQIRELSEFFKDGDRWFYVRGEEEHPHCGSGCGHQH